MRREQRGHEGAARAWARPLFVACAFACACAGVGCKRSEAAQLARDRAVLDAIVTDDARVDRALMSADEASRAGEDDRAAALLETAAAPAADLALAHVDAAHAETAWGEARKGELRALVADRRAQIPGYAAALRGTDLDAKLAAIETQVALQKRAVAVTQAIAAGGPKERR